MNIVPVILAGGIGERFWPLSRSSMPKQLLKLISEKTMAEETLLRVKGFTSKNVKPLIITGQLIADKMKQLLPKEFKYDMIVEPVGKNTAPAVALAAAWIQETYGDSVMVVLSADHDIRPREKFADAVEFAVSIAKGMQQLVVFGVKPSRPETGYGYIHLGKQLVQSGTNNGYKVKKFIEKPNQKKAESYVKSTDYLWNSGMFVWTTSVILEEFKSYMPGLFDLVKMAAKKKFTDASIKKFYQTCEKESIDYGIMEKSGRVSAVVGSFDWDDIGSWEAIPRIKGKDKSDTTISGDNIFISDMEDSIIVNDSSLTVATVGLKNVAVITTGDSVLVIDRNKLPDLKKYLTAMKESGKYSKKLF
jgi:mannose-1-phosphate guanylyltransferase